MATKAKQNAIGLEPKKVAPKKTKAEIVDGLKEATAKAAAKKTLPAPKPMREMFVTGGTLLDGKKADLHRAINVYDVRRILLEYTDTAKVEFVKDGLIVINTRGRKVAKIVTQF